MSDKYMIDPVVTGDSQCHTTRNPICQIDNLPSHAQQIYKEAFNSAWDQYEKDEERSHRVAWAAVKEKYHKNKNGDWVEGESED